MDRVRWRSGPSELVEKIEVLYNEIVNHPYLKTDDEFIEESDIIFSDVNESDWFYKYVMVMASRGYLKGKTTPVDGVDERYKDSVFGAFSHILVNGNDLHLFNPKDNLTRAEAATVLYNLLSRIEDGSYPIP